MKPLLILPLAALALTGDPIPACGAPDGFIWVNVSIKVIRNPETGQVPPTMNDALLRDSFIDMNRWLENTWRGFRLRAVDLDAAQNFKRIGTLNDTTGPGKWYNTDLKTSSNANWAFETEAEANKVLYGWNDTAINIYFNNGGYSSAHSPANPATPGRDLVQSAYGLLVTGLTSNQIASGQFAPTYKVAGNLLHETGHYFHLGHTFPDDDFADTAPDPHDDPVKRASDSRNEDIVRDAIALYAFTNHYVLLTNAWDRVRVDNTANNAMSYYQLFYDDPDQNKYLTDAERFGPKRFLFTEMQLDRWADSANAECAKVTSGRTFFVGSGSHIVQLGSSALPYKTVAGGINAARTAGQDIVLLRPGNYNERLTLSKPCTLRATRTGKAVVGTP